MGTNADIIPRFLPNFPAIQLKKSVPNAPPTHKIDPTQDASNNVNGPYDKGVCCDFNKGRLAEGHPTAIPYMKVIKFAVDFHLNDFSF